MANEAITFASVLKNPIYKKRDVLYSVNPPGGLLHRTEQKKGREVIILLTEKGNKIIKDQFLQGIIR